ncbi:MAG: hypothetical protein JW873_06230 [Candidatus Saganbacteria bacterium]|nr:hypothetical protein [Candidatus Saganbacteria bacterium]
MMMYMGSVWALLLYSLLCLFLLLGFGYIIWVMAAKESGNTKLAGQVISAVIIILALVLCLYGLAQGGKMRSQMMGQQKMMEKQMSGAMEKMPAHMKKMMRESYRK